jgi:hypothetical protein
MKVEIRGKEYFLRDLTTEDVKIVSEIMDKIEFDINDFLKPLKIEDEMSEEAVNMLLAFHGMSVFRDMINFFIKKYHLVHDEMTTFLSSIIGVTEEEFKALPFNTPIIILNKMFQENLDFFRSAAG